ncbi:MAG: ferrochelatase [Planctomycetota bacterium]
MSKTGVLLINLGTPDAPRTAEVRRYLGEFLSDPRVIDIPAAARAALLGLVILPFRSPKSALAYGKIWTDEGSPLLVAGKKLLGAVRGKLPELEIALGMRYGNPSLRSTLRELHEKGCERIVVFPLYPQYASSSTGSTLEVVYREAAKLWNTPFLLTVPPFYDDPGFIEAFGQVAEPVLAELKPDRVLLSYHGLPERHVKKCDASGAHCLVKNDCCVVIEDVNRFCYRAQCEATSRALQQRLRLEDDRVFISFQSRLGRTPWLQPFTDLVLPEWAKEGVKRVAVICPAFVADCLETLEEIGMRAREDFRKHGGEELRLVPSLNAEPAWVDAVCDLIRRTMHPAAEPEAVRT